MSNAQVCTDPDCKGGIHLSSHQNSSNRVLPCKVCRVYKTRRATNEVVQKLLAMYDAELLARGGKTEDAIDRLAESPDMLVEALKRITELEAQLATPMVHEWRCTRPDKYPAGADFRSMQGYYHEGATEEEARKAMRGQFPDDKGFDIRLYKSPAPRVAHLYRKAR